MTTYLDDEVSGTEPSLSVSVPWLARLILTRHELTGMFRLSIEIFAVSWTSAPTCQDGLAPHNNAQCLGTHFFSLWCWIHRGSKQVTQHPKGVTPHLGPWTGAQPQKGATTLSIVTFNAECLIFHCNVDSTEVQNESLSVDSCELDQPQHAEIVSKGCHDRITILNADDWFFIVMQTRQRFKTNLAIANNLIFKQAVIRTKACLGESLNAAEWTCQACLNNFLDWISISKNC
jgi:hypothetical protein